MLLHSARPLRSVLEKDFSHKYLNYIYKRMRQEEAVKFLTTSSDSENSIGVKFVEEKI